MLTVSENASHVSSALQSGVSAYVVKGCSGPELLRIVRGVQNCEIVHHSGSCGTAADAAKDTAGGTGNAGDALPNSAREPSSATAFRGPDEQGDAYKLRLTEKTVKHYMTELMQKLNVRNRVEAVLITRRQAEANSTI